MTINTTNLNVRELEAQLAQTEADLTHHKQAVVDTAYKAKNLRNAIDVAILLGEANELASNATTTYSELRILIRDAVRGFNREVWTDRIMEVLHMRQRYGGMPKAALTAIVDKNGRYMTENQEARVWAVLHAHCTDRGYDVLGRKQLGTPYPVVISHDTAIQPA